MDGAITGEGTIRIGLAHGAVQSFSEEGSGPDVIAPDRARRAGLSYFALGDWHGGVEVDAHTRYSGTPEPDRFKHDRPGEALLVSIEGAAALPDVTSVETGRFSWRTLAFDVLDGDDAVSRMEALLPDSRLRRWALIRLVAGGRARLEARTALGAAIERTRPDFAYLDFNDDALATECEVGDLDAIDRAGALREAADALLAEAGDAALSVGKREIARSALGRLYAYAQTATP